MITPVSVRKWLEKTLHIHHIDGAVVFQLLYALESILESVGFYPWHISRPGTRHWNKF